MASPECVSRCQLYKQRAQNQVPAEGLFAYSVFQRLTSPAVERFNLQSDVLDALGIRLSPARTLELVSQLDALIEGVEEGKRELKAQGQPSGTGAGSGRRR